MFRSLEQRLGKKVKIANKISTNTQNKSLSSNLIVNEQILKDLFENCSDFTAHPICINHEPKMMIFYLASLTDTKTVNQTILEPLLFQGLPDGLNNINALEQIVEQKLLSATPIKTVSKVAQLETEILKGGLAILVDGDSHALVTVIEGMEYRSIEEPETEISIRGPRDGFNESLQTNLSLIRRRIRNTQLKFEEFTIGKYSQTDVVISYIKDIVDDSILQEVKRRVEGIETDAIIDSGFIEEFIEESPFTPFPQIQNTERPDTAVANLLEGKIVILVDNTPFVLIVPMTFWESFHAAEDSYERFIYVTFIRCIRFVMFNAAVLLPSMYVALTTFHPKLIPTSLLVSIAAARENVPFPALIEALLIELVFEGLREAGIRLPKAIGSAVSIVGAIVVGEAAVQAGIVSAPMVIIVASTGIASLAIPRYNVGTALRLVRFPMLLLAGAFGLYGVAFGFIALHIHLVNLSSFGVPYFTPVAPQILTDIKDVLVKSPRWTNTFGPFFTYGRDKVRIPPGQKPVPKKKRDNK